MRKRLNARDYYTPREQRWLAAKDKLEYQPKVDAYLRKHNDEYGGLTVERIIVLARVSRATFYRHFPDKREAVIGSHEQIFARFLALIEGACPPQADWAEKVRAAIGASLEFAATEPAQAQLLVAGFLAAAPDRAKFKILPIYLTQENVGIGLAKNQAELLDAVNGELLELEQSGEALRIYHRWLDSLGGTAIGADAEGIGCVNLEEGSGFVEKAGDRDIVHGDAIRARM